MSSNDLPEVVIETEHRGAIDAVTAVYVNGVEIPSVAAVSTADAANDVTRVTITVIARRVQRSLVQSMHVADVDAAYEAERRHAASLPDDDGHANGTD